MASGRSAASAGRANGRSCSRQELQNSAVVVEVYRRLLPEDSGRANGLWKLACETWPATSEGQLSEEDRETTVGAAERLTEVISNTPGIAVDKNVSNFKRDGWEVTPDNIEDEFRAVEKQIFSDGIHWGRVIAFLAFSVSFAAYVSSRGISGGAESVFAWTVRVLDGSLADFIEKENGWRGFITYADTLLKAQGRQRQRDQPPGIWNAVAGIGAIGVTALLAIGARQAFS